MRNFDSLYYLLKRDDLIVIPSFIIVKMKLFVCLATFDAFVHLHCKLRIEIYVFDCLVAFFSFSPFAQRFVSDTCFVESAWCSKFVFDSTCFFEIFNCRFCIAFSYLAVANQSKSSWFHVDRSSIEFVQIVDSFVVVAEFVFTNTCIESCEI